MFFVNQKYLVLFGSMVVCSLYNKQYYQQNPILKIQPNQIKPVNNTQAMLNSQGHDCISQGICIEATSPLGAPIIQSGNRKFSNELINNMSNTQGNNCFGVPNIEFCKRIRWGLPTFKEFSNAHKDQLNRILSNYGILTPNTADLPNPEFLIKTLEEGISIHNSFKEFMRTNLLQVQKYLMRSVVMISDVVLELRNVVRRAESLDSQLRTNKSDLLKNQILKELIELKEESTVLEDRFNYLVNWRKKLLEGIRNSL